MTLAGPRAWTVEEVIALCEKYADSEADVSAQASVHNATPAELNCRCRAVLAQ